MSNGAGLKSDGAHFRNWEPAEHRGAPATIIVVGVPRSGTSMVATCLQELGVPLGSADRAVREDLSIAQALESGDRPTLAERIAERDAQHTVWGFKRPTAFRVLADYLDMFRNPRLVVTYRDPLAIAARNQLSMQVPLLKGLRQASRALVGLTRFVEEQSVPVMLVSYEKAMQSPDLFVNQLDEFCGSIASPEVRERAAASMENGPSVYLQSTRIDAAGHQGRFDRLESGVVDGWAWRIGQDSPVAVVVKRGDTVLARVVADGFREDLKAAKKYDGNCAFRVDLGDPSLTKDDISVEIEGTTFVLAKS